MGKHIKTVHSKEATVLSNITFYDYSGSRNPSQNRSIFDMPALFDTGKTTGMFDEVNKLIRFQHELNELARENMPQQLTLSALQNARRTIQQIYSNYIMIPKFSVNGISGGDSAID
ncbi:MAG: hypothetical protein ABJB85_02530 [Nitrososphaerota archaeon]